MVRAHSDGVYLSLNIEDSYLAGVDYWEVDPDWDGRVFRSVFQGRRPPRRGEIPAELVIQTDRLGEHAAVRLMTVSGEQELVVLDRISGYSNE